MMLPVRGEIVQIVADVGSGSCQTQTQKHLQCGNERSPFKDSMGG